MSNREKTHIEVEAEGRVASKLLTIMDGLRLPTPDMVTGSTNHPT